MSPGALAVITLIVQYGIPGFIKIWEIANKPTITEADIAELRDIKPPESYLTIKVG